MVLKWPIISTRVVGEYSRFAAVAAQGFVQRHVTASTVTSTHLRDTKHVSVSKQSHVVLIGALAAFGHIERRDDVTNILVLFLAPNRAGWTLIK